MISTKAVENIQIEGNLWLKPQYLSHELLSGNKAEKLKLNLLEARNRGYNRLLTFGGSYSNHILAVARAGNLFNFETIGIIRGAELAHKPLNYTLEQARKLGMSFEFVSREDYRYRDNDAYIDELMKNFGPFYLIPEGGTNELAVKGCEDILGAADAVFDIVCCPVGTGGSIAGIINSSRPPQHILGFPALKGDFLNDAIRKFTSGTNWQLITDYHFGGYGKINTDLISFINRFKSCYNIPLDPVYTGKMMFGIFDLIEKGIIKEESRVLAIHTGGLQGIHGMNERLKSRGLNLIET